MNGAGFEFPPYNEDLPADQVPRLEKFRAEHPQIDVTAPYSKPGNYDQWVARLGVRIVVSDHNLKEVLDQLEVLEGWFER
jgi:hypothetical protein